MANEGSVTNRRTLLKAGVVSLAGATAGCSSSDDQPDLDIEDVSMTLTDIPRIIATMVVTNDGDGVGNPTGTVKVEREGELIGKKEQKMTVIPRSESVLEGTFNFPDYDPDATYTVSGTIPGHDWVTAGE
ncbi:twin-arginine translocation signal domain-containing protein [Halosimplex sp. J119]